MESLLFGLLGALFIGSSDCIARVLAQRVSTAVLFLFVMGLPTIGMSIWYGMTDTWPLWSLSAWLQSAFSGWMNLLALFFLYRALARGPVTIASPAAASFSIILIMINLMAGQPAHELQFLSIIIVFFGIVMLSQKSKNPEEDLHHDARWLQITALYGLATGVTIAVRMFLAQEAGSELGAIEALYLNRLFALIGTIVLIFVLLSRKQTLSWPTGKSMWGFVFLLSLLEMLALGAFLYGSQGDGRILATIGFSAFAGVTATVAWLWLKEPIGLRRAIWLVVVIFGLCLAAYSTELA